MMIRIRNLFVYIQTSIVLLICLKTVEEVAFPVSASSIQSTSYPSGACNIWLKIRRSLPFFTDDNTSNRPGKNNMGNVVRMAKYDRALNVTNAIPALTFQGESLCWHRLDDGVMGGQSQTIHSTSMTLKNAEVLNGMHFTGTINTNGGGFASIRAPIPENVGLPKNAEAIRLKFRGDGKTYKLLLSNGESRFMSGSPSWQVDLPTKVLTDQEQSEELVIPLKLLQPSFGGRPSNRPSKEEVEKKYKFHEEEMRELGFMLSLRLSDGSPNPKETFGEGIFDFSLFIQSIEVLVESNDDEVREK